MRKQILTVLFGLLLTLLGGPAQAQLIKRDRTPPPPPSPTKTYPEEETEELPRFTGGVPGTKDPAVALHNFLAKAVIIPEFAVRNLLAAAVDLEFVLTADGQMDSLRVTNGACCGFNEEALRVAQLTAGKWTPGKIQGQAVRTRVELPVVFRVQNKNSVSAKRMQEMAAQFESYRSTPDFERDREAYSQKVRDQKL